MHELSIIYSILETAEKEATQRGGKYEVEAIELEIGELAGVEISSIEFLWPAAVEQTVLENATFHITRVAGEGVCSDCDRAFAIQNYFDPCPDCGSYLIQITKGEELRVKSLTLVNKPDITSIPQNWN